MLLDTGIYHSIADSLGTVGTRLIALLRGHESNTTVASEIGTQRNGALPAVRDHLVPALDRVSRPNCAIFVQASEVEAVRDELIADAQLRHRSVISDQRARDKHGGEAELIVLASGHEPEGVIATNDAGASAVGAKRNVASVHFAHVVRASVSSGTISADEALGAIDAGFRTSGLVKEERDRTCNRTWLTS